MAGNDNGKGVLRHGLAYCPRCPRLIEAAGELAVADEIAEADLPGRFVDAPAELANAVEIQRDAVEILMASLGVALQGRDEACHPIGQNGCRRPKVGAEAGGERTLVPLRQGEPRKPERAPGDPHAAERCIEDAILLDIASPVRRRFCVLSCHIEPHRLPPQ